MDPRDNIDQADLHDAPGGPEGVPADWAELGVLAALLAVVRLAQVLQVLQLPELLPVQGKGWKITNHKTMYRVTHLVVENLLLTWIWDILPSCLGPPASAGLKNIIQESLREIHVSYFLYLVSQLASVPNFQ